MNKQEGLGATSCPTPNSNGFDRLRVAVAFKGRHKGKQGVGGRASLLNALNDRVCVLALNTLNTVIVITVWPVAKNQATTCYKPCGQVYLMIPA